MKTLSTGWSRHREQGSVAVEAALVLPILLLFLAVPLFFARVFWYYSVAEKAAHDAARFLSTATQVEMKTQTGGGGDAPLANVARSIADAEIEEIKPALDAWSIAVQCDLSPCGIAVPQTVRVQVRLRISDNIFAPITDPYYKVAGEGLLLTSDLTMRYAGN
jgi:Flp pilus assembly protein TadG